MPRALGPYRPMPTGCNRHQCKKRAGLFHVSWLPFRFPATGSCFYHFLLNVGKREGGVQEFRNLARCFISWLSLRENNHNYLWDHAHSTSTANHSLAGLAESHFAEALSGNARQLLDVGFRIENGIRGRKQGP